MVYDKDGGIMKVIEGNFSQKESFTDVDLFDRIQKSLDTLRTQMSPTKDSGFLLIIESDGEVNISSDLSPEGLNFILDSVKMSTLLSSLST